MTLQSTLARAERAEKRLWRSTCLITRPAAGPKRMDPVTLKYVTPVPVIVYAGACQARPLRKDRDREAEIGGTDVEVNEYLVKVSLDADVHRLDLLIVTDCPDSAMEGRSMVVKALPATEWAVCRRLVCEEVTQ